MNQQKGFAKILIVLLFIFAALVVVGYFVLMNKFPQLKTQGLVFGPVSTLSGGCGHPPPDGSGCNTKDTSEWAGEGEQVTVNVIDKFYYDDNVTTYHPVGTYYTNKKGIYSAFLDPGNYILCVGNGGGSCSKKVVVKAGSLKFVPLLKVSLRP